MSIGTTSGLGELWGAIESDVVQGLHSAHEFPLTAMTAAVAEAIWRLPSPQGLSRSTALDVGTGTGVHALVMSACGYDVDAIDVNAEAVRFAQGRAHRLSTVVREARGLDAAQIQFHVSGVDSWKPRQRYDLIAFNPPAYYHPLGPVGNTPAAQGVFVDDDSTHDPSGSFLYRLFDRIVLPLLNPGGHIICSWPGLERRVIESVHGETRGRTMSPVEKLETWFEISIMGDRNPNTFFDRVARVGADDYGLHDAFWTNVIAARDSLMYSALVNVRDAESHTMDFRFGVLHLVRDADDMSRFRQVSTAARA